MKGIRRLIGRVLLVLAGLLILVTVVPVVQTNEWWVRIWDYPRPQLFVVSLVTFVLLLWWLPGLRRWPMLVTAMLFFATAYQGWRVVVYTPLWPVEMATTEAADDKACLSIMIANVLMENRQSRRLLDLIGEEQPDIAFIVENDAWWSRELETVSSGYEVVVDQPQDNTYGLLFMTSLDADDVELRNLTESSIPSIRAVLQTPGGQRFNFYGLHPTPPRLGQDTDVRDHELTLVAKEMRNEQQPGIVGGDLNDVAWSHTTRLFKRISQVLDPRQGRGLYSSYHADYPLLSWPLDHLFATENFEIGKLAVLPYIGSDHYPVLAEFCLRTGADNDNASQQPMRGDDREEMQETLSSD